MKKSAKAKNPKSDIVDSLKLVLADHYALMGLTHQAHWNVEGEGFFALHTAFEQQYTELFTAIDVIAERIRSMEGYPLGGLSASAKMSGVKEMDARSDAKDYVRALVVANEKVVKDCTTTRDLCGDRADPETEDMMIARIQHHSKILWMLKSFLK